MFSEIGGADVMMTLTVMSSNGHVWELERWFVNLSLLTFQRFGFSHWKVSFSCFCCQYLGLTWKRLVKGSVCILKPLCSLHFILAETWPLPTRLIPNFSVSPRFEAAPQLLCKLTFHSFDFLYDNLKLISLLLPPFSSMRDFRKQINCGNVSKISVNHVIDRFDRNPPITAR